MPDTWIDVASDAVKIGLGALLAGAFTLLGKARSHRHKLAEEYSRRRRDCIEALVTEFDRIASVGEERVQQWLLAEVSDEIATDQSLAVAAKIRERLVDDTPISRCCAELHSLSLKLTLLAFPDAAGAVAKFRVSLFQVDLPGRQPGHANHTHRSRAMNTLSADRRAVVEALAKAYAQA